MSDNISAIDKAIKNAQARKAAKLGLVIGNVASATSDAPATPEETKETKRPRITDEEKVVIAATKDAERVAKKAEREVARAARKAEREVTRIAKKVTRDGNRKTPHMSKVEKAASKLPALNFDAQVTINDITANFSAAEVAAIAAHLQHFNRAKATERARDQTIRQGDTVLIISGDSHFTGQTGVVFKVQRIRCYVTVEGARKPVYLFTSDVKLISAEAMAKSA